MNRFDFIGNLLLTLTKCIVMSHNFCRRNLNLVASAVAQSNITEIYLTHLSPAKGRLYSNKTSVFGKTKTTLFVERVC